MIPDLLPAIGGLGLFLLGMMVMTEGLKGLAGRSLRHLLTRFTRTPVSGAATGAVVTALIQSSSATTVTAVGFVGAGLLTFAQALGIIFGANIGTTLTGWLVALIGFKLDLAAMVLPLVLLGVLMRHFGSGRIKQLGWALAGFSLLFIGIDAMQEGLATFEGAVTPDDFPGDSFSGRLQLLAIGIGITLVTQSSSAGIAAALVALGSGAISFPQAAAMVIGMDVGTTVTAALATLGGSTASRRTGYAHVIYNMLTGIMALVLLDYYVSWVAPWIGSGTQGDPQLALVAFHTTFNTLGVILVLPFAETFARLIIWLVPERDSPWTGRLDDRLLADADAATDAVTQTIDDLAALAFESLHGLLTNDGSQSYRHHEELREGLDATRRYLERIRPDSRLGDNHQRHQEVLHTLDHLTRLQGRLQRHEMIDTLEADHRLRRIQKVVSHALPSQLAEIDASGLQRLERVYRLLRRWRHVFRKRTIKLSLEDLAEANVVLERLDAYRWLLRVTHHTWRIAEHFRRAAESDAPKSSAA